MNPGLEGLEEDYMTSESQTGRRACIRAPPNRGLNVVWNKVHNTEYPRNVFKIFPEFPC